MTIPFLTLLTPDQQRALGVQPPCPVAIADKVRYSELDNQNHVNNKSYIDWFERARTEHFYSLVAPHWQDSAAPFVALHTATIRYVKQMFAGETYVVTARVTGFRNSSYTVEQTIIANDLRARMEAIVVMLKPDGSSDKVALPDSLTQMFIDAGVQRS